ncbi:MAG: HNH endonuclease [Candidatus Krumholzibacteria bacterium]|jgi:5-methylcytosine-specific restriction endonuclease McrA|nr:HNH endonuclease [Candidatus Krumholzibacteria bacterium]MDP6669528.1 HNH endonuclease [Candidatus Krumholzibacteria bacterium]MDP6796784.1 HNH endonuclease [Candidatus Krumholzibacteria bacterium]MDP7020776.1 HNH endonuclease [Candidatus Krumholzibacteria bacterium]
MKIGSLSTPVLVLDAGFQPVNVVSVRRAMSLLCNGKAVAVEESNAVLRSSRSTWKMPLIIRLFISIAHRVYRVSRVKLSRKNIWGRDRYQCQYCGSREGPFTVDHIVPRSHVSREYPKGGPTTWENCVTACVPCNRSKGNEMLPQTDMKLLSRPREPHWLPPVLFLRFLKPGFHPSWDAYLYGGRE